MDVRITQDIHYTHNRQSEPIFVMTFNRGTSFNSSSMDFTIPELIAIKNAIDCFLCEQDKN
jgi:hypothetical protein